MRARCPALTGLLLLGLVLLSMPAVRRSSVSAVLGAASASAAAPLVGVAPGAPNVLVINQASPNYPVPATRRGQQIELLLRHFTPNTQLIQDTDYTPGDLFGFDYTVVIGNDSITPLAPAVLRDLADARTPVLWIGYGLGQFPDVATRAGFAPGGSGSTDPVHEVEYRGQRYPAQAGDYSLVEVYDPNVQVLARFPSPDGSIPYILHGGDIWYVNGLPTLDSQNLDPATDAPALIVADALHEFFGTGLSVDRRAVVRFEDVSVHIPPQRLRAAVDVLVAAHVPFVMGVIPAQRFPDGSVIPLQDRPAFVQALLYAQDHGATVVLHGFHHTFGSGEDFEFWDADEDAPIAGETRELYAQKVEEGIRILRDVGLEPRLWETPHYTASPLAYTTFGEYFSDAIEDREPASWLPYPVGPDPYGQTLIPENLGYINPAEGMTVDMQLQRARLLRIVRDSWAVGFYHPASIPPGELHDLVDGLRALGYRFEDLRQESLQVRYPYEPNPSIRLGNAIRVDVGGRQAMLNQELEAVPGAASVPWAWLLATGGLAIFLVRLREQWRALPSAHHATSQLEPQTGGGWLASYRVLATGIAALGLVSATFVIWNARVATRPVGEPELTDVAAQTEISDGAASAGADASACPAGACRPDRLAAGPYAPGFLQGLTDPNGWEISVYYTAVEQFHAGPAMTVTGCLVLDCSQGQDDLGVYPTEFVQAVHDEGAGRITGGPHAGMYLNWSIRTGYWLDSAPRDARGAPLDAYVSAAADAAVPYDTPLHITQCGSDVLRGSPIDATVCSRIEAAPWQVRDRFTDPRVGKHVDLYIGEEDQPAFLTSSPRAIHAVGATLVAGVQLAGASSTPQTTSGP